MIKRRFLKQVLCLTFGVLFTLGTLIAQHSGSQVVEDAAANALPDVFLIGEYDAQFEPLEQEHDMLLLTACNDNMDQAFQKWMGMIYDIEQYSKQIDFDVNGVKMWLYVFWNNDGTINHIAYHLKPNSRNVSDSSMTEFLDRFIADYAFPLQASAPYSHYGSASFPTLFEHIQKTN